MDTKLQLRQTCETSRWSVGPGWVFHIQSGRSMRARFPSPRSRLPSAGSGIERRDPFPLRHAARTGDAFSAPAAARGVVAHLAPQASRFLCASVNRGK
jgi:hypothetical protein